MSDLIERQAAIDAIVAWTVEDRPDVEMPTDLVDRVNALPSAQPERKTGEWERTSFYNATPICSECYLEGRWDWDFCPNCGADMRGDQP